MLKTATIFGVISCFFLISSSLAQPSVSLTNKNHFQAALNAGQIQPGLGWNNGFESLYPGQSGQFRVPNLMAHQDVNPNQNGKQGGLLMAWGQGADQGQQIVASWTYSFGGQQNFLNTLVSLTGYSPCASISSIGVGLIDSSGKVRTWAWAVPSQQACDTDVNVVVNPFLGAAGATGASYYGDQGFRMVEVEKVVFFEQGLWDVGAPADPGGFGQHTWNGWRQVVVESTVPTHETTWGKIKALYQ